VGDDIVEGCDDRHDDDDESLEFVSHFVVWKLYVMIICKSYNERLILCSFR